MVTLQPSITALVVSCGLTPPVDAARFCCASEEAAPSNATVATIDRMTVFIVIVLACLIELAEDLFTYLRALVWLSKEPRQLKNHRLLESTTASVCGSSCNQGNCRQKDGERSSRKQAGIGSPLTQHALREPHPNNPSPPSRA